MGEGTEHIFRFFVAEPIPARPGASVSLREEDVRHLAVLRARPGLQIELVDHDGGAWSASLDADLATATLVEPLAAPVALPHVTLYAGILTNAAWDVLVENAVQAGVDTIVPVSDVRRERTIADGRSERVARVVLAAAKQAKRRSLPRVEPAIGWSDVDPAIGGLLLSPTAERLGSLPAGDLSLVVGSASGVPPEAARRLLEGAWRSVSLGPWVMRSELAAALAIGVALDHVAPR